MEYRIEISPLPKWPDSRGRSVAVQIKNLLAMDVDEVGVREVYTIAADITAAEAERISAELANPVLQRGILGESDWRRFDWLISVGFLPGVTDNVGRSAHNAVGDIIGRELRDDEFVFSSIEYLVKGAALSESDVERIGKDLLANELIESINIYSSANRNPIPLNLPFMLDAESGVVKTYDLEVADDELMKISGDGVLALSLEEMKAIQNYFRTALDRSKFELSDQPTDVELELLAQTWSEHCKHKIFDAEIEYEDENGNVERIVSCYKSFIKKSTREIGERIDWLVSVFHDNAGVVRFNDEYDLAYKVETHNSPSALDPYGGAMTGIVGVNRDPLGTGRGCDLLINVWGYCLGSPFTPAEEVPDGLLHPRRLRDGIHKGVIDGGNQSGIPYGLGWEYFDERYLGKPLVYCGTVGLLPREIGGTPGHEKTIKPGDLVVMAGGRIGKDGIHGATFSSEELHGESPVQAVQIGDPITQKMMSDFIKEARSASLYRFITDNGAGGLSSSIGEMAEHSGGCGMDLAKAPVKYAGLQPWEILVSEAQERMSFAVPPENWEAFKKLADKRDVEVSALGEFTDDGKFHMLYNGKTVAWIDLDFMHNGLPRMKLNAKWTPPSFSEPELPESANLAVDALKLVERLNVCSNEYKARQYDHEVKGLSVIKPFVGRGRDVSGDATVSMCAPMSKEGIILSAGILPRYSDIDTYHMMACVIELAIRRIIAAGGKPDAIAGLDNFCWPDPVQSEKTPDGEYKLAQLVRANKALYDYTKAFNTPCVSGKDSMKNDCNLGGKKISIPPTVLFSAITKIDDVSKALSLDAKFAGDDVYVIGTTKPELGGSEYYASMNAVGNNVPKVDAELAAKTHHAVSAVTDAELARSAHAPALGGLSVGFAKVAMAGRLGLEIDFDAIPAESGMTAAEILFSESAARFILTAAPESSAEIAELLAGVPYAKVGKVVEEPEARFTSANLADANFALPLDAMLKSYKTPLDEV
ncbi:MAG: phosphoribosylformylglycinamidine synthase [Kiritimatiellaeota bacterium]|nr:phosphoribosylformylglycinamidine synthase [Kiritimatiellota bacterium]